MIAILLALLLNGLCYGSAYFMLPRMNSLELLVLIFFLPIVTNVFVFLKFGKTAANKLLLASVITAIAVLGYIVFGITAESGSMLTEFAMRNSYSNGNIVVSIDDNVVSVSNAAFVLLSNLSTMLIARYIKNRRNNNDSGERSFEEVQRCQ